MQNVMTTTSKSERLTTVLYVTNSLLPLKAELPSRVTTAVCCIADEGEIVVPIKMTRAAGTVRIELYPAGDSATHSLTTERAGDNRHDIARMLVSLGYDRVTARSLAFDAAIVLGCALDDMEIDNYEARRRFPLALALALTANGINI